MQIGELARVVGVNPKTIRYYEDIGVLPPARRAPNGYRTYDGDAVDRLQFIKEAQATGLTLDEITSVLELRERGSSTCQHILGLLDHHLRDLDARIRALKETRRELAGMIERAQRLDPAECTDPTRCQTIAPARHGDHGHFRRATRGADPTPAPGWEARPIGPMTTGRWQQSLRT